MSGAMRREGRDGVASAAGGASPGELLDALVSDAHPGTVIPQALDLVERDPLVSAGRFPGDLLRGLMGVPGHVWGRHPRLFERYRAALRAAASVRRLLPFEQRMAFWSPLDRIVAGTTPPPGPGAAHER